MGALTQRERQVRELVREAVKGISPELLIGLHRTVAETCARYVANKLLDEIDTLTKDTNRALMGRKGK